MINYDELAERLLKNKTKKWIGIVGGPGSGKSTLAQEVSKICNNKYNLDTVVIPMDGFHFKKSDLTKYNLFRRGAPHTFDAEGFIYMLKLAKNSNINIYFPDFCRIKSDPLENSIILKPTDQIVLIEGNYLLLGAIEDKYLSKDEQKEVNRWKPLLELFDETWFIDISIDDQKNRLINRHLETWTDCDTVFWNATNEIEGATKRTNFNDIPNSDFILKSKRYADIIINILKN